MTAKPPAPKDPPEKIIHHYLCAFVGWESAFPCNGSKTRNCPKCGRVLKEEGLDWEVLETPNQTAPDSA